MKTTENPIRLDKYHQHEREVRGVMRSDRPPFPVPGHGSRNLHASDIDQPCGRTARSMVRPAIVGLAVMACSLQFSAAAAEVPLGLVAYTVSPASPKQLHVLDTLNNSVSALPLACANPIRREPQWTPGGEWIVFAGGPSGNSQIYKVRPDGNDCQRITDGSGDLASPTLSPDGGRIVYNVGELYVINIDGSGKTNLGFGMSYPHWSPCGDKLLASDWAYGGGYNSDLWVCEFGTEKLTRITAHRPGEAYVHSAWSPDCAKIAGMFSRGGQSDIVLMNADGSSMRYLTGDWSTSGENSPC